MPNGSPNRRIGVPAFRLMTKEQFFSRWRMAESLDV